MKKRGENLTDYSASYLYTHVREMDMRMFLGTDIPRDSRLPLNDFWALAP